MSEWLLQLVRCATERGLLLRWCTYDAEPGGYMTIRDPHDGLYYEIYPVGPVRWASQWAWEIAEGGSVLFRRATLVRLLDALEHSSAE